jgi:hypothetical protein
MCCSLALNHLPINDLMPSSPSETTRSLVSRSRPLCRNTHLLFLFDARAASILNPRLFSISQQAIATNWIEAYKKYISPNPPVPKPTPLRTPEAADTAGQVWVNTKSGKYWKPGSRYYRVTKQGEYMSEEEAVQKGYWPANGTGE